MQPQVARKKFTRDEIYQLTSVGFFDGQRFELIHGDIIQKMGQKPPHADSLQAVLQLLNQALPLNRIRCQLPLEIDRFNEPEPDLAVTYEPIRGRHPQAADVALVIEVADSSLAYDTKTKLKLYAEAGIPEYWVVDLKGNQLLVHRKPSTAEGAYDEVAALGAAESVAFDGAQLPVAPMLLL